ncbi:MAG: PaaI family thioesterase [Gemmatimonadaceae bacterium]
MTAFAPVDPAFERRVRDSFARQTFMATLGATLATVRPGEVAIGLPFRHALTQQHGFLHAGVVSSVVDSACGYAALTLMPPGAAVLSVEFKVNMLAPAAGRRFVAVGRVRRAGRTITVCEGELRAHDGDAGGEGTLVALMQGTMMTVRDRPGVTD